MRLFMGVLALTILPLAAVADEGRYQGYTDSQVKGVYVLDTKTGEVKYCAKLTLTGDFKCYLTDN